MSSSDKAKRKLLFGILFEICMQFISLKKEHFQGWCESKPDRDACTASGYFKVLSSLVTSALPFLFENYQTLGVKRKCGGRLSNPFKGCFLLWHMNSSQEERRHFFNHVVFQEQEIHSKTFPFVLRQSQHHKTQGPMLRKSSIDLCM